MARRKQTADTGVLRSEQSPSFTVAIAGRPNVGKSTLFNRLCENRAALVHDQSGVTRDRRYGLAEYRGIFFRVVDTGGLDWDKENQNPRIQAQVNKQVELALDEADVILLVVDAKVGMVPADRDIAERARMRKKTIFVVANKVDGPGQEASMHEFHRLGFQAVMGVSAAHGLGMVALLDGLVAPWLRKNNDEQPDEDLSLESPSQPEKSRPIYVALVGRPNAGKSSLVNTLLGDQRMIVDDQPGTTHDAIDTPIEHQGQTYVLVDTAGMRRKARVYESIEKLSGVMTQKAIDRADVVLLVIDSVQGITEQDTKLAGLIQEQGKALILVFNKRDLIDAKQVKRLEDERDRQLQFLTWATHVVCSANQPKTARTLFSEIDRVYQSYNRRISTGELNRFFEGIVERHPPPLFKGYPIRLYYITQVQTRPPTFVISVNHPEGMHFSYERYLHNELRKAFHFVGTPLRIIAKERKSK